MRLGTIAYACLVTASFSAAIAAATDTFPADGGDLQITPLVHASVQVEHAGRVIYVDPWSIADLSNARRADLILITDADAGGHHLDTSAIGALRKADTVIVIPASGKRHIADGVVLANGDQRRFGNVTVEAVAAYDLIAGEPFHSKGVANAYVVTLGGKRVLFAGVTECVPELKALENIDIAFVPMNLPNGRMTPEAAAACVQAMSPSVVYPYHYDQGYILRRRGRGAADGGLRATQSVQVLAEMLEGRIEVRSGDWYPTR